MYDVIVIGGGSGGYAAAIRAAQLEGKVALVEGGTMGGTCVNRGCIPSKVWMRAASLIHQIRSAQELGIDAPIGSIDLNAIVNRKNGVSADIRMGMEALLQNNGAELVRGRATLKSPREVDVDGKVLETKNIIIATGSTLSYPSVPGLEEAAITSDQVLDMTTVPSSVLIFGSGYIEMEMACLLNIFGAKVTVAVESARILPREDHDTSQRITQALREKGVETLTRVKLKSVAKAQSGAGWSCFLAGAKERTVDVEAVLIASRKPATSNLGIEKLGIQLNADGGIQVNDRLETSAKGVYAIGDATGGWMMSHGASSMAIIAAQNCMGKASKYDFNLISRPLWTIPEAAAVGLSEEEAEKQGFDLEVGGFPYAINGLAMLRGESEGAVKVISDSKTGEILGVHIVGAGATEIIGEAVLAMQLEATVNELARGVRAHPTFSETVVDAARDAAGWALYLPKR